MWTLTSLNSTNRELIRLSLAIIMYSIITIILVFVFQLVLLSFPIALIFAIITYIRSDLIVDLYYNRIIERDVSKQIEKQRQLRDDYLDMTKCMSCTQEVTIDASTCRHCGFDLSKYKT